MVNRMAEIKLKTCPFCGGEAKAFKHKKTMASFGTLFSYEVECAHCFCRTGLYPSEEKAVNAWNRRKAPEIVRCGECRHRDPEDKKCDCGHDIIWQLPRGADWYCADAERRTE